ncbi:hypothetical protein NCS55_00505600 [Fusarium keratoplasticum]|nr:hypothetical protein NCS55_00505600 [Fusarium keratoplasticum]
MVQPNPYQIDGREKRVDQPDANARALNAVLKETAGKLYADRMHFLLELLQNADDCQYSPGVTPTVSLTYKEYGNGRATTLRVDCNEIGFHSENVRAICGFCESSKPAAKDHNRTTGEKGMGFKSVFEVADAVWISSGYYSFKFVNNDSGMLSMIAPHWAKLPDYERQLRGHTSMLLELSAKCDTTILLEKLKSMSPDTVLFLRNLKKIKISTIEAGKGRWETTLKRLDDSPAKHGMFSRTIQMGETLASYHVFRHIINERDLRHDDRRRDAKDSQILLAFPKADDLKAQKVHAFLPIDHYGFKFAIQADFILVSSREDVEDCLWNKALVSQVPTAFLGAVKAFQAQDITSWISYISLDHYQDTLFQDIPATIVNVLSENPILQSDQGEWLLPSRLAIVPKRFRNSDGPLIPPGARNTKYLSDGYNTPGNENRLERLGVRTLSGEEFLSDLEAFLSDDQAKFQEMEAAWHASVASVLISLITESDAITAMVYRRRISNWNLIPVLKRGTEEGSLWDCSWVSASQGTIFLPPDPRISLGLPGGLDLFEVHESVGEYPTWLDLLRLLKAEEYRVKRICDIIVSRHKSPGFSPANQSLDDLVSHAAFLKRARWSPPEGTKGDLWFAANRNSCHRGSSMYMKGDSVTQAGVPFIADVVFQNHLAQCPIHFTHESYESELTPYDKGAESWVVWLARCFDLTIIPRMALKGSSGAGQFTITPEFQFIVQNDPEAVLQLLREFWHLYKGEAKSPENQTAAFAASLESRPFLQVANPEDKNWDFLEHFGVLTKIGMKHFLVQLRQLKGSTSTTLEAAALLYEHIEHVIGPNDIKTARQAFMTEELTLVPDPETTGFHWLTLEQCVWDGPDCLKRTPRLKYIYPSRIQLFLYLLKCQTSDLVMLIQEAQSIRETDDLQHIAQVFEALSKHPDLSENAAHPLRELPIFPVTPADAPNGPYRLRTALDSDEWYISDDPKLTRVFSNLDVLSFSPSSLDSYRPLFDRLDLSHRLLSVAREIALVPEGDVQPVPSYETWLNKRIRFMIALVPTVEANKDEILLRLRHIHVFKVDRAKMSWKICRKDLSIALEQSSAVKCVALLPTDEQDLNIWLTTQDTATETDRLREIAFELAEFCGITSAKHTDLLAKVLTEQNLKHTEDEFQVLGIPFEPADSTENSEMGESLVDQLPTTTDLRASTKESLGDGRETQVVKTLSVDRLKETDQTRATDEAPAAVEDRSDHEVLSEDPSQIVKTPHDEAINGRGAAYVDKPAVVPDIVVSEAPAVASSESMSRSEQSESENTEQVTSESNSLIQGVTEKQGVLESVTNNGASRTVQKSLHTKGAAPSMWQKGSRTTRTIPIDKHDLMENLDQVTIEDDSSGETEDDKKRRGRSLGRRPGLSQTPSTHVLPSRDHSADRPEPRPRTPRSRGRDESSFVNMNQGWITVPRPMTIFSGEDTKETRYFGELYKHKVTDVYMLVRVYQIQKEPGIYIYVDPWGLQLKGDILLETEASYSARLPYSTEPFLKFSAAGFTKDTHEIYNGLDVGSRETRLLRLQLLDNGDEDDKPICGSLEVFDLDDLDEPFWAISYFWGPDPDGPAPSTFTSDRGKMPITESLASCLKCLRRKRVSTLLWADALCINQNNPMEKALQVRRMGSLYHQAEKVLVWLGTSGHKSESSPAMELMADLHRPFCRARGRCRTRKGLSERNTNATRVPDLSWKEVDGFLGHSWFTRSWIVQEAAVCPKMTMVCGQSEMEWDCFMESLMECSNGLNRHGGLDDNGAFLANSRPALALHSLRERYQGGAKFDFLRLLDMFSYTQASRARDKLFALQNLARDVATEDPLFAPDYDSPEQEVLAKYAKGLVHRGRGLDLLYRAGGDKGSNICSWIPDLLNSQRRETTIPTWDAAGREGGFCAGRPVPPRIHLQDMGSQNVPILAVRGSVIDEVEDCFELHLSAGMRVAFADVLERMRGYTSHLVDYPGLEQAPEATTRKWTDKLMIKCLVGDARGPQAVSKQSTTYSTGASRRAPVTTATWKDSDWERILDLDLGQNAWKYKQETSPESQRRLMQFWETAVAFADNIPRAVFATTKKRYAGIIPGAAQPGDKIFIADGGKVPFIISRSARVTTCYRLVGECYIHGIMYSPPSTAPDKGTDIFLI